MRVTLAKSAGFCFGVNRAINIALKTASSGVKVFMFGDIVHNEEVVRQIQKAGIKKITRLSNGRNKILLIRAHGASTLFLKKIKKRGYRIIDATCPMVKEIHKIVQEMEGTGYKIIVIGDKHHDEVHGIIGQLKTKAIVIDGINNIPVKTISKVKKACIVVQSTQDLDKVIKIVEVLKTYIPKIEFFNTICKPTRQKQEEIKIMPLNNDVMVIIGSKNSANTKRLYEISKSLNKKTHWVNSKREIRPEWFINTNRVGITAGASTPQSTIEDINNYISSLTKT